MCPKKRKSFIPFFLNIVLFLAPSMGFAESSNNLPYALVNVDMDYLSSSHSLAHFENTLDGKSYTLSGNDVLLPYFYVKDKQLFMKNNISAEVFQQLSSQCPHLNEDPHQVLCQLTVTNDEGQAANLPVIFSDGLRARTIEELLSERVKDNMVNSNKPYYAEISAIPADFSEKSTAIVNLKLYFAAASTAHFFLDASVIAGDEASCPIKHITGIHQSECAGADQFTIDNETGLLMAKGLHAGIYQINVRAETSDKDHAARAWQTFYLNVNESNPSLSAWKGGAVASSNVLGSFPSIYVYSAKDPQKGGDWDSDYKDYAKDLGLINRQYLSKQPIKTVFVEIISMLYADGQKHWLLTESKNPMEQISASAVSTNRPNIDAWINALITPFKEQGVGVTLNYTFDNPLKADFLSFNDKQQDILADQMVAPIRQYDLDGLAMDLEGGFNQPAAAELFKKIADRLAYQGKWFNFYYFGDIFKPNMFAAFGPLGVANISTYDVGQYRAPLENADRLPASVGYEEGGLKPEVISLFMQNFSKDLSCTSKNNAGLYSPVSYCSLSINDSYSENNRRFKDTYHQISTEDAVLYFNGKYQLTLPLADTATEWNAVEVWNPDFSPSVFKQGRLMTTAACTGIDHAFFVQHAEELMNSTESESYHQLQACLLSDTGSDVMPNLPMQSFSPCAKGIPYASCILVSSLPGSQTIGQATVVRSSILDYVRNNIQVYQKTNAEHAVGYSIFALENTSTAPAGAFGVAENPNITVQEPWYIGFNFPNNPDPYYNKDDVDALWKGFAGIIGGRE
jgi:hypothetical protein